MESTAAPVRDHAGSDIVPARRKAAWAIGSIADQYMTNGINNLALPIYNISLGVSPILIGYALAIPRIIDAITDPLMGSISDNARTRWGRRRPFILVGALLASLLFMLMWMPPTNLGPTGLFAYFLVISILFYLAYTIWAVPRNALGFEMCSNYHDRTTLFAMNTIFAGVAGLSIPWLYKLSFHPWFAGEGRDEIVGVRTVALLSGFIILVSAIPAALWCREKLRAQSQAKIELLRAAKLTVTNRAFLILTVVVMLVLMGVMLAGPMNLYINIYFICDGDKELGAYWGGWSGTVQAILVIATAPLIAWISRHLGKKWTILGGLCLAIIGYILTWWLFTPEWPALQVVFMLLLQPGLGCIWVLSGSMIADICDEDELKTGLRREGMFGAVYSFITKLSAACITMLAAYVLVWAGYTTPDSVTPEIMRNLRILFIVIPVCMLIVAAILITKFPITEETATQTRRALDARLSRTDVRDSTDSA